jgi:hypothetical protein
MRDRSKIVCLALGELARSSPQVRPLRFEFCESLQMTLLGL